MSTATGPSPSQRPTKGEVPAGGPIGDVDYRDIPNTQIRKVKPHQCVDLVGQSSQAFKKGQESEID